RQAEQQKQRRRDTGEARLDEAGGKGADADKGGMTEARIAREAAQDRPGNSEARRVEHQLPDPDVERRQHQRPERQQGGRGHHEQHGLDGRDLPREGPNAVPKTPGGRTSSSSTSIRNMGTLGNDGPIYCAVSVLTM